MGDTREARQSEIRELLRGVKVRRPSQPPALPEPWPRDAESDAAPASSWDSVVFKDAS